MYLSEVNKLIIAQMKSNLAKLSLKYALITPAHNEANFIDKTIKSIAAQEIKPSTWIIVNDGSTDNTLEVIKSFEEKYDFINTISTNRTPGRHFINKVLAFNKGIEQLSMEKCELIGNLDADISIEPDYFRLLLQKFESNPNLGIGGGMIHSMIDGKWISQNVALDSVAGAVQLFRRECFIEIGGYTPLQYGGIDAAAEFKARHLNWDTQTFPELIALESRPTGWANRTSLHYRISEGKKMHALGYSPLFFLIRSLYRTFDRPVLIGSVLAISTFILQILRNKKPELDSCIINHIRKEQLTKLFKLRRSNT